MSNYISSIINIDSMNRNKYPKHIYETSYNRDNDISLELLKDDKILSIKYNNHNFNINDNIVITDIKPVTKILLNSLYLIENTSYAIIKIDHDIVEKHHDYIDILYINIKTLNNDLNSYIYNIPFNIFTGIKKIFLFSDIYKETNNELSSFVFDIFNINISNNNYTDIIEKINNKFILFNTDIIFNSDLNNNYKLVECSLQLSFLDICGVEVGYINANYPINSEQYQSSHKIIKIIDDNFFQIEIIKKPFINKVIKKNIKIYKIVDTIEGYIDSNEYNIILDRTYTNIVNIELLSIEIPYVDIVIKNNINNKLYWKNLNDGNYLYYITIRDGFYTLGELIESIKLSMNNVKRNIFTTKLPIYNIFEINYDKNSFYIEFKSFEKKILSNSLFVKKKNIENNEYYILTIIFGSNLRKNDFITINDSNDIIFNDNDGYKLLNKRYINKTHMIYSNNSNVEIDIILEKINNIDIHNTDNSNDTFGGIINITIPNYFSLLFDKNDTVGELLGFKKVNTEYSITDYSHIITNDYAFINNKDLSNLTNEITNYNNDILNFSGKYNYILMYLNNIDYIKNLNLSPCFAKILLPSIPGTILFNTFVSHCNNSSSSIFPIDKLNELNILFLYPNGEKVNFKNLNNSFTIKIVEQKNIQK